MNSIYGVESVRATIKSLGIEPPFIATGLGNGTDSGAWYTTSVGLGLTIECRIILIWSDRVANGGRVYGHRSTG
jgi:hypothetical protein